MTQEGGHFTHGSTGKNSLWNIYKKHRPVGPCLTIREFFTLIPILSEPLTREQQEYSVKS